jgi:3-oxoacyl-[acyl-carrier-protein] synthase II
MTEVWVTGIGLFTPLGTDRAETFKAALAGRSAVRRAPPERSAGLPDLLMAPIAADPAERLDADCAGLDRAVQFALVAAKEALADAGIDPRPVDAPRFGVYAGIGFGGANTLENMYARYYATLHGDPAQRHRAGVVHPLSVPRMMPNAAMALIGMRYGLRGASNTYAVACASSAVAAGEAMRAIRRGDLDAAVVVGTEAMLTHGSLVAWNALRVMARPHVADVTASCRPFDRARTGFVLGEGACALVLESRARAEARGGGSVYAELAGYGNTSDAGHLTLPDAEGQAAAMRLALAEAGLHARDIHYLNAHGTATEAGDLVETQSIRAVFADDAAKLPVSSTKAVHGHLIGAGGAVELALAVLALHSGSIPPTAHLDDPDPRCALDFVPRQARHGCRIDAVMSNSFAFGGSNVSLVARRAAA